MKKTNKTFKRFAAITSASLLAACAMAPVFTSMTSYAAVGEITFKNGDTAETSNTYTAYKIFSGTATASGFGGQAELKDIQWANTEASGLLAILKVDERFNTTPEPTDEVPDPQTVNDFASCTTAASVADVLKGYQAKSEKAIAFAEVVVDNAKDLKLVGTQSEGGVIELNDTDAADGSTDDGYYVIAQTTHIGVTTAYILGVYDASAGAEVSVKVSQPTFEKKIADINDSKETTKGDWQDSADYDIGDAVPFQLSATLPSNYNEYNEFKFVFHDDLRAKMVDGTPVEVYGAPTSVKAYYDKNGDGKYNASDGDSSFEGIDATDGTDNGCQFEFVFDDLKALVEEAEVGAKIIVEYTAELLNTAVIGSAGNWNEASLEYSNNPYYTSTPDTNNTIDNDGDGDSTDDDNTETTSKTEKDQVVAFTYQTVINKVDETGAALEGATFTLEKYNKTTDVWEAKDVVVTDGSIFTFTGLDDGDYRLTETKAPVGYNPLGESITFSIIAEHTDGAEPALKSLNTITATSESTVIQLGENEANVIFNDGMITADIENKSGATLPGTGGIGTTIFYLGGGAMAAIGGIYLISKRRMRKSEE